MADKKVTDCPNCNKSMHLERYYNEIDNKNRFEFTCAVCNFELSLIIPDRLIPKVFEELNLPKN